MCKYCLAWKTFFTNDIVPINNILLQYHVHFSDALTYTFLICFFSSICEKPHVHATIILLKIYYRAATRHIDKKKLVSAKNRQRDTPYVRLIFKMKKNIIYLITR